ncbi:hypothetical protein V8E36_009288 [Tilletia maclaganii]
MAKACPRSYKNIQVLLYIFSSDECHHSPGCSAATLSSWRQGSHLLSLRPPSAAHTADDSAVGVAHRSHPRRCPHHSVRRCGSEARSRAVAPCRCYRG